MHQLLRNLLAPGLLMLSAAAGCADAGADADGPPAVVARDSAGVSIVENGDLARAPEWRPSAAPTFEVGSVDGEGPESLFRVAGVVTLGDGGVAVLNGGTGEIRIFDRDGSFVRSMGRKGEGPGEFTGPRGMWLLDGDSLLVWDGRLRRLTVFGPDGELGRVTPLVGQPINPDVVTPLEDGGFILLDLVLDIPPSGYAPMPLAITRHDGTGAAADSLPREVFSEMGLWDLGGGATRVSSRLFGWRTSVVGDPTGYWVATGRSYQLRRHDPTGALVRIVRWEGPDRTVTDADVQADLQGILDRSPDGDPALLRRQHAARDVAERFPAYSRVLPGWNGGALVLQYERPRDQAAPPWLLFDRDGRLRARLALPARFLPFEMGDGWIVGVERDEMDVEHVRRYRLTEDPPPTLPE